MAVKGRYEFLPVKSVFELLKNPKQPGVMKNEVIRFQNDAINTASKSERFDDFQREFNVGKPGLDCGFGNDVYQPLCQRTVKMVKYQYGKIIVGKMKKCTIRFYWFLEAYHLHPGISMEIRPWQHGRNFSVGRNFGFSQRIEE